MAEVGRLDIVIANAGVMPVFGERSNEFAAWQLCLDVLLTGVLNTVELTYQQIVEQGDGGSIVITSSMAALQPMMRTESSHTLGLLGTRRPRPRSSTWRATTRASSPSTGSA